MSGPAERDGGEAALATLHAAELAGGTIFSVEDRGSRVRAFVRSAQGRVVIVELTGVVGVRAERPEGMVVRALVELADAGGARRFAFVAADDADGGRRLEVRAAGLRLTRPDGGAAAE